MVRPAPQLDRLTRRTARGAAGRGRTRPDHTPSGVAMHGPAADVNGDGVVTVSDLGVVSANHNSGDELKPGDTGYDPDAFLDGGDEIDVGVFLTRYSPYVSGGSNPTFNAGWIDNPNDPNGPDNSIGYNGYVFDLAGATEATSTGLYMVRHRVYDPKLGRWLQNDPAGYVDGSNLLLYVGSSPVRHSDPTGEAIPIVIGGVVIVITATEAAAAIFWCICSRLSYTKQLRDYAAFARERGLQFKLTVRKETRLSSPLQREVDAGRIELLNTLP